MNLNKYFAYSKEICFSDVEFKIISKNELSSLGVNDSIEHVDFMIGSLDMNIYGIKKDVAEVYCDSKIESQVNRITVKKGDSFFIV